MKKKIIMLVREKGLVGSSNPSRNALIRKVRGFKGNNRNFNGNSGNQNGKKNGKNESKLPITQSIHDTVTRMFSELSANGETCSLEQIRHQKTLEESDEELYLESTARPWIPKHITEEEREILSQEIFGKGSFYVSTGNNLSLSYGKTTRNYFREYLQRKILQKQG